MTDRTVLVGFDALDFRYLDAFESSLPNFSALREEGVEAPLRSTFPPWTGSAWPSMYTGTDPSHHGVYGFFHHTEGYPDDDELVTRNRVRRPAIWNYLDATDDPAVALNVPVTHPAESIDGALVPGYLAHEDDAGHPEGVRDELSDAIGEPYTIYSRGETSDDKAEKRAGYLDLIDLRARAAEHLLDAYDWKVAVVQVQKTDAVFHNFDDRETFRAVYERADDLLGRVRDVVDDDTNVVVCSDHGIGPVDGYTVYLNEVLREHGFVETTSDASNPTLATEKSALTGEGGGGESSADGTGTKPTATARAVSAATTALGAVGVTPGDAYGVAKRIGVDDLLTSVLPDEAIAAAGESVDWTASAAYCRTAELGVRINLDGREPNGVVPADDYERVRDELVELLSALRTPDGDPVFEWVKRREEVYDGPFAEHACDVLFLPTEMNHVVSPSLIGQRFVPVADHDHKLDGAFLAAGPAFDADADLDRLSLTDVAPVALASVGRDVPERMTGSVPEGLLERDHSRVAYGDVPFGSDAEATEDDGSVEERLSDLGYL
ncbi:alkaline phosphatase family protein [Halorussus amylolyticus]|uniref:alkaline phosphatase family protein n=1 Tax=Halorussus amylolyticus TaxID=1126242 RepID=UPI001043C1BD|nr:alkaline phosphatase family protein [Halorussus amylolyticus]